jgi:hypothetical protein
MRQGREIETESESESDHLMILQLLHVRTD